MDSEMELTGKQFRAIILLALGNSNKSVSEMLGVSLMTLWRWQKDTTFQQLFSHITEAGVALPAKILDADVDTIAAVARNVLDRKTLPSELRLQALFLLILASPTLKAAVEKRLVQDSTATDIEGLVSCL